MKTSLAGTSRRASVTIEALLVLPVLLIVAAGGVELGMLLSTRHQLWGACREIGRLAACGHDRARLEAVLTHYLGDARSAHAELVLVDKTGRTVAQPSEIPAGETITVMLRLPASCAAPDLLRLVGFSLHGQVIEAQTVWRRE